MQIGLSATASFPGFELSGEIKTDDDELLRKGGNAISGFEALLGTLISDDAKTAESADNQTLADALAGMAEALKPLAKAFDNLQFPDSEQLEAARNALGALVEAINGHSNRADISLKAPIGLFAAQLSELRQAGIEMRRPEVGDFAGIGQLLGRLGKLLNMDNGNAAPNIHQMIEKLERISQGFETLPAQTQAMMKGPAVSSEMALALSQNPALNDGKIPFAQNILPTVIAGGKTPQAPTIATGTVLGEPGSEGDILAQLAKFGEGEAAINKQVRDVAQPLNFAQANKEANLQAAATYPQLQRAMQAGDQGLVNQLDAIETDGDQLIAQHRVEQFQQQVNHIDAAQNRPGPRQINIPAVAVEIVRQVRQGLQRFEVRLDPPEMGRIDVQMEMDGKNVTARLVVERAETLDFLMRDARGLERALQQAGLNADRANLQFSLKQDQQGGGFQQFAGRQDQNGHIRDNRGDVDDELSREAQLAEHISSVRGTLQDGGLNLWV